MTPIKFDEANVADASQSPTRFSLLQRILVNDEVHEWSITCWKLSFWERLQLLFTGKVWAMRTDRTTELTLNKQEVIK